VSWFTDAFVRHGILALAADTVEGAKMGGVIHGDIIFVMKRRKGLDYVLFLHWSFLG